MFTWWFVNHIGECVSEALLIYQVNDDTRGAPDRWWPWMWKYGWSELHVLRVLYRALPIFLVDAILYLVTLLWAWLHGIPEWNPPNGKAS